MSSTNDLCPLLANVTLSISVGLCIITAVLMRLFWKNRETPAFKCRRVNMTLAVSFCIILSMIFPNLAAYNLCNGGNKQNTIYFHLTAAAIYLYGLWLITYRTWILFINWKMAITQLTETGDIKTNKWWTIYRYFATQKAIKRGYIVITIWIAIMIVTGDLDVYLHSSHVGQWIIRSAFIFWSFVSLILLILARKMRDHFALMMEMKIYIVFNVLMVALLTITAERLNIWANEYSDQQLIQFRIVMNVIRSGISAVLFLAFPLIKFRYSFGGDVFDTNLFNEASFIPKKTKKKSNAIESNHLIMDSNGNVDLHKQTKSMFHSVDAERYPSLLAFLLKNNKCYEVFKKHLADCLAVENLLFFTSAQRFRLQLKLAMQARIDDGRIALELIPGNNSNGSSHHGSTVIFSGSTADHTTKRYWILRLDFFYLQKSGGLEIDEGSIKEKWLDIYDNFLCDDSPYQINVDYDKYDEIERFKQRINDDTMDVTVSEYVDSLEEAMIEVWILMETLYLHFQTSDKYKQFVAHNFPQFNEKLSKNTKDVKEADKKQAKGTENV